MEPIAISGADQLAAALPGSAAADLMEWNSSGDLRGYLKNALARRIVVEPLLNRDPRVRIVDDRPFNEYFWLRKLGLLNVGAQ
jgi:hypothetical protein